VGIRFFDLRAAYFLSDVTIRPDFPPDPSADNRSRSDLPVYHDIIGSLATYQQSCLSDHFKIMKQYLRDNPSEWIIVRLSQENIGPEYDNITGFGPRIQEFIPKYPVLIINDGTIPTVAQAQGKIILFADGFPLNGALQWQDNSNLTVQDDYNQEIVAPDCCNKIGLMIEQQEKADNDFSLWNFNFASGSGTPPPVECSPRDVAYRTNKDLGRFLLVEKK